MNKKIIFIAVLIILIGLIYFLYLFFIKKSEKNLIKAYGNIEIRQVDLSFQVSGIINNVFKEEGDYIKEGELLATLDDKDYKANYKKAYFQELASEAEAKDALSNYQRNYPLCFDNTISKQECENLLNKKDNTKAQFELNKANKEFQKNQLDYTRLYAPQNGIISSRVQEKGARVEKSQIVYVMNLTKPIWVRTYIKEKDLGNIKYGQKARVITDTDNLKTRKKKEYEGYIGYISPVAEFTPKTVQTEDIRGDLVYRIRVYIDKEDEFLRQGMPVTVKINLDENNG